MNLLFKSSNRVKKDLNIIIINKTCVVFNPEVCENYGISEEGYAGIGKDSNDQLCIYYSPNKVRGLFSLYKHSSHSGVMFKYAYSRYQDIITQYLGDYKVTSITTEGPCIVLKLAPAYETIKSYEDLKSNTL